MKIVALNGSPKKTGNTYNAIKLVFDELEKEGIETEIIQIGSKNIRGCTACNACSKTKNERCIIDDEINGIIQKMKNADGIILGSPVYFSGIAGTMKSALDRIFYVSGSNGNIFRNKIGDSVVAFRHSGGMPTFQQLNNYINYAEMVIPTSNYWNVAHGTLPGDVLKDIEGVQVMRVLGKNMAWLIKLLENGKGIVPVPEKEVKEWMNFIRKD